MIKYLKEYRFYIILFLFVLIPIINLDTSNRAPREFRFYDRMIVYLTAPVQLGITASLDFLVSGFQNYFFLLNTRQENLELAAENRKLQSIIVNLRETQQENIRIRKLLGFKEKFKVKTVVSRVIGNDVSTEYQAIRINRGSKHGIQKNMAVVNAEGVVGRVLRTTHFTSDVVTILDSLSAIDAIDKRSRAHGIVEGMTDQACRLKYALRTDDIQVGDVLISSGLEGIFPKGIPLGTVSNVTKRAYGITQNVEVVPSVNFSKLEEVLVIVGRSKAPVHTKEVAKEVAQK